MKIVNRFILPLLLTIPLLGNSKPLFIGDSLTYPLAVSYQNHAPLDAKFLESTGLNSKTLLDWQGYINEIDLGRYETIYIVLGTNDQIHKKDIPAYQDKAESFIKKIKQQNKNVVWLLPPTLKNTYKNTLLSNTRAAIKGAATNQNISLIDMREALGIEYSEDINGVVVRTRDGIHLTPKGAELVINDLIKKNRKGA